VQLSAFPVFPQLPIKGTQRTPAYPPNLMLRTQSVLLFLIKRKYFFKGGKKKKDGSMVLEHVTWNSSLAQKLLKAVLCT
jgi:hypothetical protein